MDGRKLISLRSATSCKCKLLTHIYQNTAVHTELLGTLSVLVIFQHSRTRTSHSAPVMSVIPALITLFAEWRLSAHCTGGHWQCCWSAEVLVAKFYITCTIVLHVAPLNFLASYSCILACLSCLLAGSRLKVACQASWTQCSLSLLFYFYLFIFFVCAVMATAGE